MSEHFDYVFAGAGMSALSLVCRLMDDRFFSEKKILLIDADEKKLNDRTWSFWETGPGYFEELVYKSWAQVKVTSCEWSKTFDIYPYTYKMIRGIDFYQHVFKRLKEHNNISFRQETIVDIQKANPNRVRTEQRLYTADFIFDSLFNLNDLKRVRDIPVLYQHFKGYFIESKVPLDPEVVTFMDFSIPQNDSLQFIYILPFNRHHCLVEHTYFSQNFVTEETYDTTLNQYCDQILGQSNWKKRETEKGVIPMTTAKFLNEKGGNIIPLGTLGGFTKASSGYTFYFMQKAAKSIAEDLKNGITPRREKSRFNLYDALLLRVLAKDEGYGHQLFSNLFKSASPELVFRFLNEESTIVQDLSIITKSPTRRFTKALLEEMAYRIGLA